MGQGFRLRVMSAVAAVLLTAAGCSWIERASLSGSDGQGNAVSSDPALSADGRYVAFASAASNLVAGDTNDVTDVFVRDVVTKAVERVSVPSGGWAVEWSECASGDQRRRSLRSVSFLRDEPRG
jgi:hypothetical protein